MQGFKSISVMTVLALAATLAAAQQRGGPRVTPGFLAIGQRQAPQRQDRGARNSAPPQNPGSAQPQMQQRQGDQRFIFRGPGPHAGQWLREHEDEPVEQQLKQLESDPKYKQLPPERQQQLRNRLLRFNNLTPQQRDRMLNNLEVIEHMTPQQKQQFQAMSSQLRQLPDDRRRALSGALRQLRDMNPEDRQKAIDSDEYRKNYSDKERDILRGMTDLGLMPHNPQD